MSPTDYIPNSGDSYVFTSSINRLPIKTQLVGDRAGEPIETFMICLPDAQVLQSMGAQAIEPMCVTITIVDDDSKFRLASSIVIINNNILKPYYYNMSFMMYTIKQLLSSASRTHLKQ